MIDNIRTWYLVLGICRMLWTEGYGPSTSSALPVPCFDRPERQEKEINKKESEIHRILNIQDSDREILVMSQGRKLGEDTRPGPRRDIVHPVQDPKHKKHAKSPESADHRTFGQARNKDPHGQVDTP